MVKAPMATLNQKAYAKLVERIVKGGYAAGAQLDERLLAQDLGVSRTPLRSAIAQLVREGLIEYVPYRGNYVRRWTKKEVDDLFRVRIALESLAVKLAIPKLSNEDIERIRVILDEVDAALSAGDMERFSDADSRFHAFIHRKADNKTLIEALARISLQIQMIRTVANRDSDVVARTLEERPRILAALAARDEEAGVRLLEEHIDGVRRAVLAQLPASDAEMA